ncbi:hypothetical protein GQ602_003124 [Ophiocordyceps camponoti-floridani]|uniref:Cyanovirin-N domain-containing protein n=1 Tax=Ophiocordyceps camponoti-floridani TaxID=2030778 RepID=A0A8H4Q7I8_9HYPO|nr:hypothetical protein GQ602_003124 [Ophiocordyceps camponoti-floridani]
MMNPILILLIFPVLVTSVSLIDPLEPPPFDPFKLRKGLLRCDFKKWMGLKGYRICLVGKKLCNVPPAINETHHSCSRVSCSWNIGIKLCNRNPDTSFTVSCHVPSFYATQIAINCRSRAREQNYYMGNVSIPGTDAYVLNLRQEC